MAFDNIRLEKGLYADNAGGLTAALEKLDPSEQYRGTPLSDLDAFQRQLKRFDIHVRGQNADVVAKFFASIDSAVLFPEFVARAVRQGMEDRNILPQLTATITTIQGQDYRGITSAQTEEHKSRRVSETAHIPQTTIRTQDNLTPLYKRGRMLVASYEAVRYQKIDLFAVTLRQIGAQIMQSHLQDAIDVIIHGDGNQNPAVKVPAADITYNVLLDFWSRFSPYEMNTVLCPRDVMLKILQFAEFQNPLTGLNFQNTGKMSNPLGAALLRADSMPAGQLIGIDKNYALEMVRSGDVSVEYDKLIDRQLERAAITSTAGFSKIFPDAAKVLGN